MEHRTLGGTGIMVSAIGLGVEHFRQHMATSIADVIKEATKRGVNYFDLVWSLPHVVDGVSHGIEGARNIHLAVHLGSSHDNGKYVKAKSTKKCEETFRETLDRLNADNVSVINLHYVRGLKQWKEATRPEGALELAVRLRDEGLGKIVAVSTHSLDVVRLSAVHSEIESVMYQVNMANHALPGRDEALFLCREKGVGVVAMKPYAAGNMLRMNKKTSFPEYKTGGLRFEALIPEGISPVKCLHYSLSQLGVCCVVSGPKDTQELRSTLNYFDAIDEEKNYEPELQYILNQI